MDQAAYLFDPSPFAERGILGDHTLGSVIEASVAAHSDRLAVVDGTTRLTYAGLDARAAALAATLAERSITKGDVVGLHLPNSWEYLVTHIALGRLGAVALPLHPPYRAHELRHLLTWTGAVAIVCAESEREKIAAIGVPELQIIIVTPALLAEYTGRHAPPVIVAPGDPISLNPTSGTESLRPNVCMHAHDAFVSNSLAVAQRAKLSAGDRVFISGGFTHLFGGAGLQAALCAGATLVCQAKFDAAVWLDLCEREAVTHAWTPLPLLAALLAEQRTHPRTLALREVRTGGSAVASEFAADVRETLGGTFTIQWGMSEILAGATTLDDDPPFRAATLGTPFHHAEARIVEGELWWRAADVFRGYYRDPAATAAAVTPDGWVRTGDLAAIEPDGSLAFHGRSKDIINRGGLKIGAYEVEALLSSLTALRQIAVVAVPDATMGEKSALVCSLRPGCTLALTDVTAHLDALGVAKYKWPEHLIVLDELPTTATGKVAKQAVRALIAAAVPL